MVFMSDLKISNCKLFKLPIMHIFLLLFRHWGSLESKKFPVDFCNLYTLKF